MLPKIFDLASITHSVPFDPTYGFTLQDLYQGKGGALMEGEAEPADFDAFWQGVLAEQMAIEPKILERRPAATRQQKLAPDYIVEEIYFEVIDGWRVGGWLCRPADDSRLKRLIVFGHGYGGRQEISADALDNGEVAGLFITAPGFDLSVDNKRVVSNNSAFHVINGIEDPRGYILRACVAAYWQGGRILQGFYPNLPMFYDGTSFGGGLGVMILAWGGSIFRGGFIGQPTFANHSFRLSKPTHGSASAVRALWDRANEAKRKVVRHTLSYYETAFHAKRIQVPVAYWMSVFDPAVPAAGQFTVALNTPKSLRRMAPHTVGHFEFSHPLQKLEERRRQAARKWLWHRAGA